MKKLLSSGKFISLWALMMSLSGCVAAYMGLPRPQEPKTRSYVIEQVSFLGGSGDQMAGELTIPATGGPFPGAVLITGSGPHDRNETIAGHKPFLVLSDYLTKAGFAVLRYDDRGVGQSKGSYERAALSDFAADAAAAHTWLSAHPSIEKSSIGFIGHSEGGYIAPIAANYVETAFMVFLASPARRLLPDVMITQTKDILIAEKQENALIETAARQYRESSLILSGPGSVEEIREALAAYSDREGLSKRQKADVLKTFGNQWGVEHARHDSETLLAASKVPVLALFGDKDLQVSAKVEAPIMKSLLKHPQSQVIVFKDMNHLFQPTKTGLLSEYIKNDITLDPKVMTRIASWLKVQHPNGKEPSE